MKTAIFAPSFLDGFDNFGGDRLIRTIKYMDWYEPLLGKLGASRIFLSDNGSDPSSVHQLDCDVLGATESFHCRDLKNLRAISGSKTTVLWFQEKYSRGPEFEYPYCWRNLYAVKILIGFGYEKIITIDTDGFIVSPGLTDYVRNSQSGWEAFWIKKYRFPSAEFHILNKDSFSHFMEFTTPHFMTYNGRCMEAELPFTRVDRFFDCDRYGEDRTPQHRGMDFYAQCPVDFEVKYNLGEAKNGQES